MPRLAAWPRVVGVALMVDGLAAGWWASAMFGSIGTRDLIETVAIGARVLAGASALTAGWLVVQQRPAGAALARVAAPMTAAIVSIGLWMRWLPSNLDPAMRLPTAAGYLAAATLIVWWARHTMRGGVRGE